MPKQQPIPVTQSEYDELRAAGYGREGPSKSSFASCLHSGIGNVQKGDAFAIQQRRGMLAEVEDSDDDSDDDSDYKAIWNTVSGVFAIAAGIGALAYGGYKAYKYFTSSDEGSSSRTSTSSTLRLRQEDVRPTDALSRVNAYEGNVWEDVKEDFVNTTKRVNEEQGIPTLKLREAVSSVQSTDESAKANDYEIKVEDVVNGEVFNPTDKNLTKDCEKSEMLNLRSTNPFSEDVQAVTKKDSTAVEDVKAADKSGKEDSEKLQQLNQPLDDAPECSSAIEEVKEEDLDAADRNGKEDSEKLQQVNQPTTDAPLKEAQANMKDEEKDEDFNGECVGKPDHMTNSLRSG